MSGEFDLDHFVPQTLSPERAAEYDNLLYCCRLCNGARRAHLVPNPMVALTSEHVFVHADGEMEGLTSDARKLIQIIDLNEEAYCRWRRMWIRIIELAARYDPLLYEQLMGFPEDLPDLSRLRPPEGNTRPEGVAHSYFEQRKRGTLAQLY